MKRFARWMFRRAFLKFIPRPAARRLGRFPVASRPRTLMTFFPLESRDMAGNVANGFVGVAFGGATAEPIDRMAAVVGDFAMLGRPADSVLAGGQPVSLSVGSYTTGSEVDLVDGPTAADGNGSAGRTSASQTAEAETATFGSGDAGSPEGFEDDTPAYRPVAFFSAADFSPIPVSSSGGSGGDLFPPQAGAVPPTEPATTVPLPASESPFVLSAAGPSARAAAFDDEPSNPPPAAEGQPANSDGPSPFAPAASSASYGPYGGAGPYGGGSPYGGGGPYGYPTVTVEAVDPIAAEGPGSTGVFRIVRGGDLLYPLTVGYSLGGTATVGADYDDPAPDARTVTFAVGSNSAAVLVSPIDDDETEGPETVTLTLDRTSYDYGPTQFATVTIVDDEEGEANGLPVVGVVAVKNASESGPNGRLVFTRTGGDLEQPLTVSYTPGGTATADEDYLPLEGSVTFASGQTDVPVLVTPIDDLDVEPLEIVSVALSGGTGYAVGSLNRTQVSISDNDGPDGDDPIPPTATVVHVRGSKDGAESDVYGYNPYGPGPYALATDGEFTFTRSGGDLSKPLVVPFNTSGVAQEGSDYTGLGGAVTFKPYELIVFVPVLVVNDAVPEPTEALTVTLAPTEPLIVAGGPAGIIILDNDAATNPYGNPDPYGNPNPYGNPPPYTNPDPGPYTGPYGNDPGPYTNPGPYTSPPPPPYGTSGPYGSDYGYDSGGAHGVARQTAASGYGDTYPYTYPYSPPPPTSPPPVYPPPTTPPPTSPPTSPPPGAITVSVDPTGAVNASEQGETTGQFKLKLSSGSYTGQVHVYFDLDGKAIGGTDYVSPTSQEVTFTGGVTTALVTIRAKDDAAVEGNESVTLTILSAHNTGSPQAVVGAPDGGTIYIIDNDGTSPPPPTSPPPTSPPTSPPPTSPPPAVTVWVDSTTNGAEQGPQAGSITVKRSGDLSAATTVAFDLDGEADAPDDFTVGTAYFAAGATAAVVTVPVVDDPYYDPAERAILTIRASADYTTKAGYATGTVTIADNEPAPQVWISATHNAAEPFTNGWVQFSRSGDLKTGTIVSISASGTATAGSSNNGYYDYQSLGSYVVFQPGEATKVVPVNVFDDAVYDPNETVDVAILPFNAAFGAQMGYTVGSPSAATVVITDNELPTKVSVTAAGNAWEKNPSTGAPSAGWFTLTRTGTTTGGLTVNFTLAGTATPGSDYTPTAGSSTSASFAAGATTTKVYVSPVNDSVFDPGETVVLTLGSGSGYTVDSPAAQTLTILDDELAVRVTALSAAAEPSTTGYFRFELLGDTPSSATAYYTVDGTATAGVDYKALPGSVFLSTGTATDVPVSVLDDLRVEPTETVRVTVAANSKFAIVSPGSATVAIADDDVLASVRITGHKDAREQGQEGWFEVGRTGSTKGLLAVHYTITSTATADSDYYIPTSTLYFQDGQTSNWFNVYALDDSVYDPGETVTVTLVPDPDYYAVGTPGSDTLRILDNDAKVTITKEADAAEPGTNGRFRVDRTVEDATGALTVSYTVGGTATAGSDYAALPGTVQIAANALSAFIPVTVVDNYLVEPTETVVVSLTPSSKYLLDTPASATLSITDDDVMPVVTITAGGSVREQGATSSWFEVARSGYNKGDITVNLRVGGTATNGQDYQALPQTVVIPHLAWSAKVNLKAIDDAVYDPGEVVTVEVLPNTGYYDVGTPKAATVGIADNEAKYAITKLADAAEPSTNGRFQVTRTIEDTGVTRTLAYQVGGTASPTTDYTTLAGTVSFSVTDTAFIDVPVLDDPRPELDETVVVTLQPTGGDVASPGSAVVTVTDDDQDTALVTVTASGQPAETMGGVPGTFTFTRTYVANSSKRAEPLTVSYAVSGTATNGADYATLTGTVEIPAGQASVAVQLLPVDDPEVEPTEDVTVTVTDAVPYYLGESPKSATLTILDNDPAKVWIEAAGDAYEPDKAGRFKLWRDGGDISQPLSVALTVDGSAVLDTDYTGLSSTAVIPANERIIYLTATPRADDTEEAVELVRVQVDATSDYTPQSPTRATIRLYDDHSIEDERPTVWMRAVDPIASEFGPSGAAYEFVRTGNLSDPLTVSFAVTGTADEEADYEPLYHAVTFYSDDRRAWAWVRPSPDQWKEDPETVTLTLIDSEAYAVGSSPATAVIRDDPPVAWVVPGEDAYESGSKGQFVFRRTGGDLAQDLTVFFKIGGTAENDVDYVHAYEYAVIQAGQWEATFDFAAYRDNRVEGPESVVLTLETDYGYLVAADAKAAEIHIQDDPPFVGVYGFNAATEPDQAGNFYLYRTGGDVSEPLLVEFTVGGSATAGEDFDELAGAIEFPAGEFSVPVPIVPRRDDEIEGAETVSLTLTGGGVTYQFLNDSATIPIYDDPPRVSIQSDADATEPGTPGRFILTRSGGDAQEPVTVTVSYGGSATAGSDYTQPPTTFEIAGGATSRIVSLHPLADNDVEGDETVEITVQSSSDYVVGYQSTTAVVIHDDPPRVSVYKAADTGEPNRKGGLLFKRRGGDLSQALDVQYQVDEGSTATPGADYQTLSGSVTIPEGADSQLVDVIGVDDTLDEDTEVIGVTVVGTSHYQPELGHVEINVLDDDGGLQLDLTKDVVDEGEDFALLGKLPETPFGFPMPQLVTVDWGDDSPPSFEWTAPGAKTFTVWHHYKDDGPSPGNATPADDYTITAWVPEPFNPLKFHSGNIDISVGNVVPTGAEFRWEAPKRDANGVLAVWDPDAPDARHVYLGFKPLDPSDAVEDPNRVGDVHKYTIDWGDGSPVEADKDGSHNSHDYKTKDLPPGAPDSIDEYTVTATVADDDQPDQRGTSTDTIRVLSRSPFVTFSVEGETAGKAGDMLPLTAPLPGGTQFHGLEGSLVTLADAYVRRAGTAEWYTARVSWGDGTTSDTTMTRSPYDDRVWAIAPVTHRYADDPEWVGNVPQPKYQVTVEAFAKGYAAISKTEGIYIDNVVPSNLTADLQFNENPAQPRQVSVVGSFADPGSNDPHTVEVRWDANANDPPATVELPRGLNTFDPASDAFAQYAAKHPDEAKQLKEAIEQRFSHAYQNVPAGGVQIRVTVYDNNRTPTTNADRRALYGESSKASEAVKRYYDESKNVVTGTWFEVAFEAVGKLFSIVGEKAKQFYDSAKQFVDDTVGGMLAIGESLAAIFDGDSIKTILNALFDNPTKFISNFAGTVGGALQDLFDRETLPARLQTVALKWIASKLPNVSESDFPDPRSASTPDVVGFALKLLGLDWEHLLGAAVKVVGAENLELLNKAYDTVSQYINADETDEAKIQAKILDAANSLIPNLLNMNKIGDDTINAVKKYVTDKLIPSFAETLATKLVAGQFTTLFELAKWVADGVQQAKTKVNGQASPIIKFLDVVKVIVQQAENISKGETTVARQKIGEAINNVATLALDLGLTLLKLDKIPNDIAAVIQKVVDNIADKLERLGRKMQSLATAALAKVTGLVNAKVGPEAGNETYAGLASGEPEFWTVKNKRGTRGEKHRLWVSLDKNYAVTVYLASNKQSLDVVISTWLSEAAARGQRFATLVNELNTKFAGQKAAVLKDLTNKAKALSTKQPTKDNPKAIRTAYLDYISDPAVKAAVKDLRSIIEKIQALLLDRSCFVAGTPVLTPGGWRPIESLRPGDEVLSRAEDDPSADVAVRIAEKVMARFGRVLHVHAGGQVIGTTPEHPFWVVGRGWTPAAELAPGDRLLAHDNQETPVEEVYDTQQEAEVYNLRVRDDHTYFVGSAAWGWSAWVHNEYAFLSGLKVVEQLESKGKTKLSDTDKQSIRETIWKKGTYGGVGDLEALTDTLVDAANQTDRMTLLNEHLDLPESKDQRSKLEAKVKSPPQGGAGDGDDDEGTEGEVVGTDPTPTPPTLSGWNEYIRVTYTTDARDKTYAAYKTEYDAFITEIAAETSGTVKTHKTHGHHIVYKKGSDTSVAFSQEAKDILLFRDIDPYLGKENLAFEPNQGHPAAALQYILGQLKAGEKPKTRAKIVIALQDAARRYLRRTLPGMSREGKDQT